MKQSQMHASNANADIPDTNERNDVHTPIEIQSGKRAFRPVGRAPRIKVESSEVPERTHESGDNVEKTSIQGCVVSSCLINEADMLDCC